MRTKKTKTVSEGAALILESLKNGQALLKFQKMIIAQGVDETVAHDLCFKRDYAKVFGKKSQYVSLIKSTQTGYIKSIDALELGLCAVKLGSGRAKAGDKISYEVGFRLLKFVGDQINIGNLFFFIAKSYWQNSPKIQQSALSNFRFLSIFSAKLADKSGGKSSEKSQ